MTVLFGGFGVCGVPENLIAALLEKKTKNITAVGNDCCTVDFGLGLLVESQQVSKLIAGYVGHHDNIAEYLRKGQIELHLTPLGTLAEKLRAGGAGIPAFFTPTGYGTVVQKGNFPVKYRVGGSGEVEEVSAPKETRDFNGRHYVLENSIVGDFACVKAWKTDKAGNVVFRATARNSNPDCARAGKICIVEVEEIVETGELSPDEIHLPGIYVDRIVLGEKYVKPIENLKFFNSTTSNMNNFGDGTKELSIRDRIAKRASQEFRDGMYVNLGIGIPTAVANFIPEGMNVVLQSENGLLGVGPYPLLGNQDADLVNAGKETVTYLPGSSTFCSSDSFAMIRGQHIDIAILGCLEVSSNGHFASWIVPGKMIKGMGGAMDLVSSCQRIIVATSHTDKSGRPKIMDVCSLPLTGESVVDMIITELAVFKVDRHGKNMMTLLEVADGVSVDEIRSKTAAAFDVSPNLKNVTAVAFDVSPNLKSIQL
jgi:3-oxoacid CoA-transferase